MLKVVMTLVATLAILAGVLGTLMVLVVAMASGANSSPEQLRHLKYFMLAALLVGIGCLAAGTILLVKDFPTWATVVGGFPMAFVFGTMVWLSIRA